MKRYALTALLLGAAILSFTGCKKKDREMVDLSGIHTTAAVEKETMAPTTEAADAEKTEPETESTVSSTEATPIIAASIETLTITDRKPDAAISVQYPVVSELSDTSRQAQVNKLLKTNATAWLDALSDEELPDQAEIKCEVKSIDRNRITVVYTGVYSKKGAAYPTNMFYTNTVDLNQVKSLGFNDYSDGYTMAGYVMSDDVQFVSSDLSSELLEYRKSQSVEAFTDLFNQADFPLKKQEDGNVSFPKSFSYTDKGVLYFSIPVPHALGDYALVSFPMDGK